MSIITLPVSLGEAIDKLTILDIKLMNINDPLRKADCQKEKDLLYEKLQDYVKDFYFWYNVLKAVNAEIWRLQDILRESNNSDNETAKYVLDLNDMRFRIKNKINQFSSSHLKEQKGYKSKNIFFTTPLTIESAFKYRNILYYLSIEYDNVYIIPSDFSLIELFQPNIHLINIQDLQKLGTGTTNTICHHPINEDLIDELKLYKELLPHLIPKSCLFICHLGLGDLINMSGAIHYISENFDDIYILTYTKNYEAVKILFSTNHKVKIINFQREREIYIDETNETYISFFQPIANHMVNQYKSGIYFNPLKCYLNLPICFYDDLQLCSDIRFSHFRLPIVEESKKLYDLIKGKKYIFVQQQSSDNMLSIVKWDKDNILTIDPNINVYSPGDSFYEIAEEFVNKPFFYYTDTIQNATEIHVVDSSFSVLTTYISNLKATMKKVYDRSTGKELDYFHCILEKEVNAICKKYNIEPYENNSLAGKAMGLGDLLMNVRCAKQNNISIPIYLNVSIFPSFYDNPANAFEFRIQFIKDLLQANHLPPDTFKFIRSTNLEADQSYNFKNISFERLDFPFLPLPECLQNKTYIIMHTKLRHTKDIHYDILKENIKDFFQEFKSPVPIVLLGERNFPDTFERKIHGITTIYNELLYLNKDNEVIDLTQDEIFNCLDYDQFKKDISIIHGSSINISFGLGGPLCNAMAFSNKTIAFIPPTDDVLYDRDNLRNNNIFYHDNLQSFFSDIFRSTFNLS